LIGKSGSGKTTVTNLMLRTLDPDSGQIFFDGTPEEELAVEWIREQIALVPQDPFLFYGTIADNLRMAKQDGTDEELLAALKAAELLDFIESSPAGLDTKVGDQGMALSGGQAQRLALLIAHRLSTIEQADRMIVLDNGRLSESGTRDELLASGGIYASMVRTKREIENQALMPAAAG